jgi:hypothetical protein
MLARGTKDKEHAMSQKPNTAIAVVGIDIGKNSFHVVGQDERGTIVLRQKWSRQSLPAECCKCVASISAPRNSPTYFRTRR